MEEKQEEESGRLKVSGYFRGQCLNIAKDILLGNNEVGGRVFNLENDDDINALFGLAERIIEAGVKHGFEVVEESKVKKWITYPECGTTKWLVSHYDTCKCGNARPKAEDAEVYDGFWGGGSGAEAQNERD